MELSNLTLQSRVEELNRTIEAYTERAKQHEQEKTILLSQKEAEHAQHLAKLDEKIRKVLAAKDVELSNVRGVLRTKEAKLKISEDALAQLNSELVSVRKR